MFANELSWTLNLSASIFYVFLKFYLQVIFLVIFVFEDKRFLRLIKIHNYFTLLPQRLLTLKKKLGLTFAVFLKLLSWSSTGWRPDIFVFWKLNEIHKNFKRILQIFRDKWLKILFVSVFIPAENTIISSFVSQVKNWLDPKKVLIINCTKKCTEVYYYVMYN